MQEILKEANKLAKKRRGSKYTLTICWMVGHEGIAGNELADQEAKKAAEGLSSNKNTLPCYLRKPLLINRSAIKQVYNANLKKLWIL